MALYLKMNTLTGFIRSIRKRNEKILKQTPHNNVGRSSFSAVCHALDLLRDDEAVIFCFVGQVAA